MCSNLLDQKEVGLMPNLLNDKTILPDLLLSFCSSTAKTKRKWHKHVSLQIGKKKEENKSNEA